MWFFQSGWFLWSNRRKKYGKEYEHPGANNWNGIIKGRKPGISVNISIPNGAYIMQEDNNMAMLIENEDGNFYLIPRIEAERESSKQEQ